MGHQYSARRPRNLPTLATSGFDTDRNSRHECNYPDRPTIHVAEMRRPPMSLRGWIATGKLTEMRLLRRLGNPRTDLASLWRSFVLSGNFRSDALEDELTK